MSLKGKRDKKGLRKMTSRSRGGEGGCPKRDVVREVAWIYSYDWSKMRDKGGEGV